MSINILEAVQKNLGYPVLIKIDARTDAVVKNENSSQVDNFSQAAIPAVLAAIFRFSQSDEGAAAILKNADNINWIDQIFYDNKHAVLQSIAAYADQSQEDPAAEMNTIAKEAISIAKENLAANPGIKEVKMFFSGQINNILLYLPPALHMGEFLYDDTLDDNTNKMEGPISSLIKSIGSAFSTPVTADDIKIQ